MMQIHFYDKVFRTERKEGTFEKMRSYINQNLELEDSESYIYEYSIKKINNSKEIYYILNENNYDQFLVHNVSDIFIYFTLEETHNYNENREENIILEREEPEEDNPDFYQEEEDDENKGININNIQEDIFLKEKIKQTIINQQKQKIRESRLKQEKEERERERLKQQNKINLDEKNESNINYNYENDLDNKEIIDIIEQNFEKFKDNLINESKVQTTQIVMESKLKLDGNNDNYIETPCSVEIHNGTACNGCGDFPIIGVRYKCVECNDFDFCEKCYEEKKYIHKHPFYKLRFSIQ